MTNNKNERIETNNGTGAVVYRTADGWVGVRLDGETRVEGGRVGPPPAREGDPRHPRTRKPRDGASAVMTNTNLPIEVAQMIEQLGGRRIFAMAFTGCVYSTASDDDAQCPADHAVVLSLEIARPLRRTARGAAKVIVALEWDDTYTVKLWKAPTAAESARGEHEGRYFQEQRRVYADQLQAVVERMTGLVLSLGTMRWAVR